MGVTPLPFDPRSPCFCHQNCGSFRQPTTRWWVVYQSAVPSIPQLNTGVLVEFDSQTFPDRRCLFVPDVLPAGVTVLSLELFPLPPIPGSDLLRSTLVETNVGDQNNFEIFESAPCDIGYVLPVSQTTLNAGPVALTPVRWYQNADDVPH